MTDREYDYCHKMQERNSTIKTNLLTFSFTTVLVILGIAITSDESLHPVTYLIPYCLIIPFQARISYYRLIHARISAYMEIVCPSDVKLDIIGQYVPEKQTNFFTIIAIFFTIIAILVNYEMFILSCGTACIFYSKCSFPKLQDFSIIDYIMIILPILFSALVFAIITYAFDYGKWKKRYRSEWEKSIT